MADWGAFAQGLVGNFGSGMRMGLMAQRAKMEEQQAQVAAQKEERQMKMLEEQQAMSRSKYVLDVFSNKNIPKSVKAKMYPVFNQAIKTLYPDMEIDIGQLDLDNPVVQGRIAQARNIFNDKKLDAQTRRDSILALQGEDMTDDEIRVLGEWKSALENDIKRQTTPKPTNMPPWYDTMIRERYGSKADDQGTRREFDDWLTTPEGQQASSAYRKKYAGETAAPIYPVVQTGTGFSQVNLRNPGQPSTPVAGPKGDTLGKPLATGQIQELADLKRTHDQLKEVGLKISDKKFKSGPLEGRWQKLKIKFMAVGPTQEVVNELESLITIAYGLSGKQMSYQEMQILKTAMLPKLEQPKENLSATVKWVQKWLESTHNDRLQYYKDSGYRTDIKPLGASSLPYARVTGPKGQIAVIDNKATFDELKKNGKLPKGKLEILGGGSSATPKTAPKTGEVRNGYRFKGGNPADKNNWIKVAK
jgi:hypothetical protein